MRAVMSGEQFGSLTFIRELDKRYGGKARYALLKCSCGALVERNLSHVLRGRSKKCLSCASVGKNITHGHCVGGKSTATYECWVAMHKRCSNSDHPNYTDYGGRGITVCARWSRFDEFLCDMGEKPPRLSLDRFPNPNGNYEPGNCRWATMREQNNNRRGNTLLEFNGKRLTISQWAVETGIKDCTISERLRHGWSIERTLSSPTRRPLTALRDAFTGAGGSVA